MWPVWNRLGRWIARDISLLAIPSQRVQTYDELINEIGLRARLDAIRETRDVVQRRVTAYQQRAQRYYNKRVKPRSFIAGDLVCRKLAVARPVEARGALAPNWKDSVFLKQLEMEPIHWKLWMESQFLELGMVIISEKLLNETCTRMHILMKCPFSSFSDLFLCSINCSFKCKDLI